jgi:hypothetical protein
MTQHKTVKFADVIHLNTDRVADPASAGIDRFVGLEHIEPENLHIRRWGLVADGTTFTNTFKSGQVLFTKRRANDGNLSIPLYARGKAVSDEKGGYATDGLKTAINAWEESSEKVHKTIESLLTILE